MAILFHRHRAGKSALRAWKAKRRATIREDWRFWLQIPAGIALLVVAIAFTHGVAQLFGGIALGGLLMVAFVGWLVGGDAHSLSWLWGREGEIATEELLLELEREGWRVIHDIPYERGNWDHLLVGPGGVFMLETKRYEAPARFHDDALFFGRTRFAGGSLRASAFKLHTRLKEFAPCPFVQAVVVIWGPFDATCVESTKVVYISAAKLVPWLRNRPARLESEQVESLARAARELQLERV